MNTDKELMQQALEALELLSRLPTDNALDYADNAITALRERLAQPVQEPVATVVARQYEDGTYAGNALDWAGRNCEDDLPVGTKLYTSQHPKQEQEPFCYHDGRNIVGKEYADHSDVFPLYTSPNLEQQKPVRFKCTVVDDAHPNGVPLSQWGKQHEMQPCAGRNCGSTNPNLHSAECFEDYEKATGMRAWQGLTDEEKAELDAEHGDDTLAHLDAIEAKLREKNA